jgi:hypothetical protein
LPLDVAELVERLRAGIGFVPPALFAVILLAGPTVGWLLYRFIVQPRYQRMLGGGDVDAMWVCTLCRSVNDLRVDQCYRCGARADELELEVIDPTPLSRPRLTPVGPGLDLGGRPRPKRPRPVGPAAASAIGRPIGDNDLLEFDPELREAAAVEERAARPRRRSSRPSTPVGPGRPEVAQRRARASGDRPSPGDGTAA